MGIRSRSVAHSSTMRIATPMANSSEWSISSASEPAVGVAYLAAEA